MGRRPRKRRVRLRRRTRTLWPDHNPLRRTYDRVEAAVVAGTLVIFLVGAPVAGLLAAQWAYRASVSAQQVQQATWHQVTAITLADATSSWYGATAVASWTAPNGQRRTGAVSAPERAKAGTRVKVWVDAAGRQVTSPMRDAEVAGNVALVAALTVMGVGVLVLGCAAITHLVLNRRRLAAWEADWRVTEPQWTHRRLG